jgi:hypothetical protein
MMKRLSSSLQTTYGRVHCISTTSSSCQLHGVIRSLSAAPPLASSPVWKNGEIGLSGNDSDDNMITGIRTRGDVDNMIAHLWGNHASHILRSSRLLHVTSVHAPIHNPASSTPSSLFAATAVTPSNDNDIMPTLAVTSTSPKSSIDFFLLNLCRSLADADIITGGILRCEPRLTCNVIGPAADALLAWRYEGNYQADIIQQASFTHHTYRIIMMMPID